MKKEVDEPLNDDPESAEEESQVDWSSNIKKSLLVGLLAEIPIAALVLPFVVRSPHLSNFEAVTVVVMLLTFGCSFFMLTFCMLTCRTVFQIREKISAESDSQRVS